MRKQNSVDVETLDEPIYIDGSDYAKDSKSVSSALESKLPFALFSQKPEIAERAASSFFTGIGSLLSDTPFGKGFQKSVLDASLDTIGANAQAYGKAMQDDRLSSPDAIFDIAKSGVGSLFLDSSKAFGAFPVTSESERMTMPVSSWIQKWGIDLQYKNQEILKKIGADNPNYQGADKLAFDFGGATGSVFTSFGLALMSGNPQLAAGYFGLIQKAQTYKEMTRTANIKDVASGKISQVAYDVFKDNFEVDLEGNYATGQFSRDSRFEMVRPPTHTKYANAISTVAAIPEATLEYVGLQTVMSGLRGVRPLLRTSMVAVEQGVQEALQQGSEEFLAKIGWDRPGTKTEIAQRIGYAAILGMLLGVPTGAISTLALQNSIKGEWMEKTGMSEAELEGVLEKINVRVVELGENEAKDFVNSMLGVAVFQGKDQTETPEFKAWFGNSKVVDENGKPLVVYHGTDKNFTVFDKKLSGETTGAKSASKGIFFTSDKRTAESYATYAAENGATRKLMDEADALHDKAQKTQKEADWNNYEEAVIKIEEIEAELQKKGGQGQNVKPVYLAIENPKVIDAKGERFTDIADSINKHIDTAKVKGHDGVIIKNLDDSATFSNASADHYVVFDEKKIKSAIGNKGTFDSNNPDIRFQISDGSGFTKEKALAQWEKLKDLIPSRYQAFFLDYISRDFRAFASTMQNLIALTKDLKNTSVPHEVFHVIWGEVLNDKQRQFLSTEVEALTGQRDPLEVEEYLAERFGEHWAGRDRRLSELGGNTEQFIRDMGTFFKSFFGNIGNIEQAFNDMIKAPAKSEIKAQENIVDDEVRFQVREESMNPDDFEDFESKTPEEIRTRLDDAEDEAIRAMAEIEMLTEALAFRKNVGKFRKPDKEYLKEEFKNIPKAYITKDEAFPKLDELADSMGMSEEELRQAILSHEENRTKIKARYEQARQAIRDFASLKSVLKKNLNKKLRRMKIDEHKVMRENTEEPFDFSSLEEIQPPEGSAKQKTMDAPFDSSSLESVQPPEGGETQSLIESVFEETEEDRSLDPPTVRGGITPPEFLFGDWADRNAFLLSRETLERNIEKVAGKEAEKVKEFITEPIKVNETAKSDWLRLMKELVRSEYKRLGIKFRSKEDALVMRFGEGRITEAELGKETKNDKQVIEASGVFKGLYDEALQTINDIRKRFGYDPILKRKDYFRHFQEVGTVIDQFGIIMGKEELPTEISGITSLFKPGKPFTNTELKRIGGDFTELASASFDNYLESVANQIFHTDSVQRARALEKYIRDAGREGIADLPNFVANLAEYGNLLAGKKHSFDRGFESTFGRGIYRFVTELKSRIGVNLIAGNISSALTNFAPLTQLVATSNPKNVQKGLFEAFMSPSRKDFFQIDGQRSSLYSRRFKDGKLAPNWQEKIADNLSGIFTAVDLFVTKFYLATKYYDAIERGLSQEMAMQEADNLTARAIADRSWGQLPNLFQAKGPTSIFTQFQVETNNLLSFITQDMPKEAKRQGKNLILHYVLLALFSSLFNSLYEKLVGRRPVLDPIYALMTLIGFSKAGKGREFPERLSTSLKDIAGNIPFSQFLFPSSGRFPISGAIPDISKVKGWDSAFGELIRWAVTVGPKTGGGGQVRKTIQGLNDFARGGSFTRGENVRRKYRIEQNPQNFFRALLFGKYSFPEAVDYYSGLGAKKQNKRRGR